MKGADMQADLAAAQREHWDGTYQAHPAMYGTEPSSPAVHAAQVFKDAGVESVLELAAGHGRDALYFAREGFSVVATDFSEVAVEQIRHTAQVQGVAANLVATVHDLRQPLPVDDGAFDAVFAHMALCMAFSTAEIQRAMAEIRRVLRPGGTLIYTVRHTGDAHYCAGESRGDDIFEHGGFAVHFFPRELVEDLAAGWTLHEVHAFEEGDLPRRLWRITVTS
ncbi:6-O-methylguanine DNA methyltransferase [Mycobacteroides saopaulense]|uniref:class I SAM-dependent methyltransferase n=1 Tax=Mycobacteroides saopaulense TaxID=1578165 RepID=UPI000720CADD|nr:class I SAM-dependent methyltransferase [Mycobacteroides saopaulense]ALR13635.1 6-O-methylguanine DNA methyltransferase [Mycobacteroides saopaulense]